MYTLSGRLFLVLYVCVCVCVCVFFVFFFVFAAFPSIAPDSEN